MGGPHLGRHLLLSSLLLVHAQHNHGGAPAFDGSHHRLVVKFITACELPNSNDCEYKGSIGLPSFTRDKSKYRPTFDPDMSHPTMLKMSWHSDTYERGVEFEIEYYGSAWIGMGN